MPRPAITSPGDLTDALIRVVADHGLEGVSIRAVAREAAVSIGTVQYHFATKDDLLLAAYRRAIDRVATRARDLPDPQADPAAHIRALLLELLPLDDARRSELRVAMAFTAHAIHSPRLTVLYTHGYQALVHAVAEALEHAAQQNQAVAGIDPRRESIQAVALADGLAWHLLCAPAALAPDEATAALDAHLVRLLPGSGRSARELDG